MTMGIQGQWDQWGNLERTVLVVSEECLGNTDGLVPEEKTANQVDLLITQNLTFNVNCKVKEVAVDREEKEENEDTKGNQESRDRPDHPVKETVTPNGLA